MKTYVYIDGFNLCYAIKGSGFQWLNPKHMVREVLPSADIRKVRYFTARVTGALDLQAPRRQQAEVLQVGIDCSALGSRSVFLLTPPNRFGAAQRLVNVATYQRHIRRSHLAASQFPESVFAPDGTRITKPSTW